MNTIELERSHNCWLATFHDNTNINGMTIPTPFTPKATFDMVKQGVLQNNQGYNVVDVTK